jgi:iodotyrosine deiodinase
MPARRQFILTWVQPGLAGLMDGSVSTLAPIFATAFATQDTWTTFLVGAAASVGAGISMGFTEAAHDDGVLSGRGSPWKRGLASGVMTTLGGLGHALPYLIPDFWTATTIAMIVVFVELVGDCLDSEQVHGNPLPARRLAGGSGRCFGLCGRGVDRGRLMYRKGEVSYQPLPLPDRVQMGPDGVAEGRRGLSCLYEKASFGARLFPRPVASEVIAACIAAAGTAPFGGQPPALAFRGDRRSGHEGPHPRPGPRRKSAPSMQGGAGDEWLAALEPIGTGVSKPHLTDAPWLIVVFAQRYGMTEDGTRYKNYYVPESVGIATGLLIAAIHHAGLVCLEHTPNPMKFLGPSCAAGRIMKSR